MTVHASRAARSAIGGSWLGSASHRGVLDAQVQADVRVQGADVVLDTSQGMEAVHASVAYCHGTWSVADGSVG